MENKSRMTSRMDGKPQASKNSEGLLLSQIVRAVRLRHRTAKYVSMHASELGIQTAAGRGEHRRFDLYDAVHLALCTRLIMSGLTLEKAIRVTKWCEENARPKVGSFPYQADFRNPWVIRLRDAKYVSFCRKKGSLWRDPWEFSPIDDLNKVETFDLALDEHLMMQFSVTDLAWKLSRVG